MTATTLQPITIQSPGQYVDVASKIEGERALKKEIVAFFGAPDPVTGKSLKQAAMEPHRALCARENAMLAAVEARITLYDAALVSYDNEQQRIAREQAEADKAAIEQEEEEQRTEAIAERTAAGDVDGALAIAETPKQNVVVHTSAATPYVPGLGFRETPKGAVTNEMELLCAITRPTIYREIAAGFMKKAAEPANERDRPALKRCADYLERLAGITFQAATPALVAFKPAEINKLVSNQGGAKAKIPGVTVIVNKTSQNRNAGR